MSKRIVNLWIQFVILLQGLIFIASCSIESNFGEAEEMVNASIMDTQKTCQRDDQCQTINQRCCGDKEEFVAVNTDAAGTIMNMLGAECAKSKEACKYKAPEKSPNAMCVNGYCELKSLDGALSATACETDIQCEAFDRDCCNTGKDYIAINKQFGAEKRNKKYAHCKKKLQESPDLCSQSNKLRKFDKSVRTKCIENKCEIK